MSQYLSLHTTVYDYGVDKAHTQSFYVSLSMLADNVAELKLKFYYKSI